MQLSSMFAHVKSQRPAELFTSGVPPPSPSSWNCYGLQPCRSLYPRSHSHSAEIRIQPPRIVAILTSATAASLVLQQGRRRVKTMMHQQIGSTEDFGRQEELPPHLKRENQANIENVIKRIRGEIPHDEIYGVSTGWHSLDKFYRPVPGEVAIVSGIPGSGKSEWLLSLAVHIAKDIGWKIGVCSFEHKKVRLFLKLLEKIHSKQFANLDKTKIDFDWAVEHFHLIGKENGFEEMDINEILESANHCRMTKGLNGLIIDPFNYIKQPLFCNETKFVSDMLSKLKRYAQKHKCHIWLVVHPVKQNAESKGQLDLYSCAGSANFYNKCDVGIIVNRDRRDGGSTKIEVQKMRNRDAGAIGTAPLWFDTHRRDYIEDGPLIGPSA